MFRLEHLLCSLSILLLTTDSVWSAEITEVRFAGTLSQPSAGGDQVLREFEALLLHSTDTSFFHVLDDEREGCPWPESYGQLMTANGPKPHLLYKYDGNPYSIALPSLRLNLPDDAAEGSTWTDGSWTFEITSRGTEAGEEILNVTGGERRGRRQTLQVLADSGLLLSARQDVFMGQGDKFALTVKNTSADTLPADAADRVSQLQSEMLTLQRELKRRPDSQLAELSARQIEIVMPKIDQLSALAKDTPLQEAALRIRRDVERQHGRIAKTMDRQQQLLNKDAPGFSLNRVTGGLVDSETLKGKTVVLHFWKYAEKPLSEPYGQVGYLEFLYNKRKASGVEVVGIATNTALQQPNSSRSAKRATRKLIEFMNLTYPIGYDDGSLLRAFGDPRDVGGKLPLWVVISSSGKVVHYHGGFYEVDRRQGLKELDEVLRQQLQPNANK